MNQAVYNSQDEKQKITANRCQVRIDAYEGILKNKSAPISKTKLEQQKKPRLINDDDNELLDLMNLNKELSAAEDRILELEDNATKNNIASPPLFKTRIKVLEAILRAALYSNPQKGTTLQIL
ncbi:hypothetical protein A0J61_03888 [Choanephora cucurbitarum]|uniref:Uncharacterized protein n=1 Tax=Choanephora cucurbitarum TaxID=101091 RepID=A0A1C7NG40_9FUNG|nr:hypothetical protein A0J61_03888 [Choanephora cucurbitarum]